MGTGGKSSESNEVVITRIEDTESGHSTGGSVRPPYRLAYCDTIDPDEEVNVLIAATKEFFNSTLENVPIPWRESSEVEATTGGKQLALMGAIMRWMGVHADGTPISLSFWEKLRYGRPINKMTHKISHVRKQARWVLDKTTSEYQLAPGQTDYQDQILLQEFLMEQLSPVCRFAVKRDLFNLDSSVPGRVSCNLWVGTWLGLLACWVFMAYWSMNWSLTNGSTVAKAWGVVLVIVILTDCLLNEVFQVFFINVVVTDKLRPQIRQVYRVLRHVMLTRLREGFVPSNDVKIVQHTSAACRASRYTQLAALASSSILNLLDDCDIAICRLQRLLRVWDIGYIAFITLYVPSLMNGCYEVVQQSVLDITLPIIWCCVLLLCYVLVAVSPGLLAAFCLVCAIIAVFFFFIAKSEWFMRLTNRRRDSTEYDIEELRNQNVIHMEPESWQAKDKISEDVVQWSGMNNTDPLGRDLSGFQFDPVEFDRSLCEEPMDGLFDSYVSQEPERVDVNDVNCVAESYEIAESGESDAVALGETSYSEHLSLSRE